MNRIHEHQQKRNAGTHGYMIHQCIKLSMLRNRNSWIHNTRIKDIEEYINTRIQYCIDTVIQDTNNNMRDSKIEVKYFHAIL